MCNSSRQYINTIEQKKGQTYNQHRDHQVPLGDLRMGEDIVEYIGHLHFIFLT